jgi:hypothetical protein
LSFSKKTQPVSPYQSINISDPAYLHKDDKYDPDGFWDGEAIDDDKYHPAYRPKA